MTIGKLTEHIESSCHDHLVYAVLNGREYPCNRYSRYGDDNIAFLLSHVPATAYRLLQELRFLYRYKDFGIVFSYYGKSYPVNAIEYKGNHIKLICGGEKC